QAGRQVKATVTDHIVARKFGGTDDWSNLSALCGRCNRVKGICASGGAIRNENKSPNPGNRRQSRGCRQKRHSILDDRMSGVAWLRCRRFVFLAEDGSHDGDNSSNRAPIGYAAIPRKKMFPPLTSPPGDASLRSRLTTRA
ncbi:MAG TPA: HNH endonuclease signature motif containing protein, partial [Vicinamibacterales bacterium]|nr:HNH endonuclease signature motif containing protein [Vicinamibacterales bacterium]